MKSPKINKKVNQRALCKTRFVEFSRKRTARGYCWMNYGSTRHYLISFCHFPYQVMKCPALGSGMQRGGRAVTFCRKSSTLRYRSSRTALIQVRLESAVEQRASSMKPHQVSFTVNALLYLPACHEGPEWFEHLSRSFGCQPRIVVVMSCMFP